MFKQTFKNQSKKYYSLLLDYLLSKQAKKAKADEIKKKEIMKFLDCDEILPAFLLLYLNFRGVLTVLDKLFEIFNDLIKDAK